MQISSDFSRFFSIFRFLLLYHFLVEGQRISLLLFMMVPAIRFVLDFYAHISNDENGIKNSREIATCTKGYMGYIRFIQTKCIHFLALKCLAFTANF